MDTIAVFLHGILGEHVVLKFPLGYEQGDQSKFFASWNEHFIG